MTDWVKRTMMRARISVLCAGWLACTSAAWADSQGAVSASEVDQRVEQKLREYFASPAFDQQIDDAVDRYVQRQQEAAARKKREASEAAMKNLPPVNPHEDYIKGELKAQFTLIEYSDFECPYCKSFHKNALAFMSNHNEVNWVYRHFPLSFHNPGAQKQAEAAECVGAQKGREAFWRYTDALFERTRSGGNGFPVTKLAGLAEEQGVDVKAFETCLSSGQMQKRVETQHQSGLAAGVTGTPGSFLVNNRTGQMVPLNGALPVSALEEALKSISQE